MGKREKERSGIGQALSGMFGAEKGTKTNEAASESDSAQKSAERLDPAPGAPEHQSEEAPPPSAEPTYVDTAVPPRRENTTYFAAGTVVEGTLRSDSDVEIVGDFRGEISSAGKVTIHANTVSSIAAKKLELIGSTLVGDVIVSGDVLLDENSSISGNVRAVNLDNAGAITGNLNIQSSLALHEHARVAGDVNAALLSVERGAKLNGKVDMKT